MMATLATLVRASAGMNASVPSVIQSRIDQWPRRNRTAAPTSPPARQSVQAPVRNAPKTPRQNRIVHGSSAIRRVKRPAVLQQRAARARKRTPVERGEADLMVIESRTDQAPRAGEIDGVTAWITRMLVRQTTHAHNILII